MDSLSSVQQTTFSHLPLNTILQQQLERQGFTEPTAIQARAIPHLLDEEPTDFHGQAQTGTGKTLAFGLPLLQRIDSEVKATQALVVAPTRELAQQIHTSLKSFADACGVTTSLVYGGMPIDQQIRELKSGAHLVIGTPGRINDHLRRGTLTLDHVTTLVLDEADIMLDMGFREEIDEILRYTRAEKRRIWLFSATVKDGIDQLKRHHMGETASVRVSKQSVGTPTTYQYYCVAPSRHRVKALARIIETAPDFYAFVFCQTKLLASEVADALTRYGYNAGALHGDMSQAQRNAVIKKFKQRSYDIVVATDVAARGIDVADLTHVINYSMPEDLESYVHRVGRTGRAGKTGTAITFVNPRDVRTVSIVERRFHVRIHQMEIPKAEDIRAARIEQIKQQLEAPATSEEDENAQQKQVHELVSSYDASHLRSLVARLMYDRYLRSVAHEDDAVFARAHTDAHTQAREIMLAVGTDDGIDRTAMRTFIKEQGSLSSKQIIKLRVIRRKTFVEVAESCARGLIERLRNASLAGRRVRPQLVEGGEQGRSGQRSTSQRKRPPRSGNGFRRTPSRRNVRT